MSKKKPIKKRLNPQRMSKLREMRGDSFKEPKNNYIWITKEEYNALFKVAPNKRLFFDIETTPNIVTSWRAGWNITITHEDVIEERKIICISYKWENEDRVHTLKWDKNRDDKKMLEDFVKIANESDEMIAHNGDKFDIKWLRTRCLYHRIPMMPIYKTLDTKKKAVKGFYFNSNKLDYIANFLGLGGKLKHRGFDMWKEILLGDNKTSNLALEEMIEYCEKDVVLLEDVYKVMSPYMEHNIHMGVLKGGSKHSCPECGAEESKLVKTIVTKAGTIQRLMECPICGKVYKVSNLVYRKMLESNG